MHEAQMHPSNSFLTLTYSPENLPADLSLDKPELQRFIKRLRMHLDYNHNQKIRYYACGEYGEKEADKYEGNLGRPHYHICLFGWDFPDKKLLSVNRGNRLYRSGTLEKIWTLGHSSIGTLTTSSAGYVARYCTKKIHGEMAEDHYKGREPEFAAMSLKPAIGKPWLDKYKTDIQSTGDCIHNGHITKMPRYYDRVLQKEDPETYYIMQNKRLDRIENTPRKNLPWHHHQSAETIKKAQITSLKRGLKNDP